MGLDMYALAIRADFLKAAVGDKQTDINIDKVLGAEMESSEIESCEDSKARFLRNDIHLEKMKSDGVLIPGFAYWRKFNHLHGWMNECYARKGGEDSSFNCCTLVLTTEDLTRLEHEASGLTSALGFFFGSDDAMEADDVKEIVSFVRLAKASIEKGYAIVYHAWY